MNKPRILLPLALAGLVLTAALTTAALVNAVEDPPKAVTDAALQQAKVDALFDVAPMSVSKRSKLVMADATLLQAEVDALFDVAPMSVPKPTGAGKIR